jgi:hypothetical protein
MFQVLRRKVKNYGEQKASSARGGVSAGFIRRVEEIEDENENEDDIS